MKYNNDLVRDMVCLCEPSNDDHNAALVALVAAGDNEARRRLIEGNMSFVINRVGAYIRHYPDIEHLRDDMTSAGMVGLCKAVNNIPRVHTVTNATAYLSYWIRREVLRLISAECPPIDPDRDNTDEEETDVEQVSRVDCGYSLVDLREVIYLCCQTEVERELVRLREIDGLDCSEIAPVIGVARPTAYRMLRRIEQRFNEKMTEIDTVKVTP